MLDEDTVGMLLVPVYNRWLRRSVTWRHGTALAACQSVAPWSRNTFQPRDPLLRLLKTFEENFARLGTGI